MATTTEQEKQTSSAPEIVNLPDTNEYVDQTGHAAQQEDHL
jgi:hypothetical protein